jgi:hemerythrin-like domain-containing protein
MLEDDKHLSRRQVMTAAMAVGGAALVTPASLIALPQSQSKEPEVTATEDLMREHGVLRRALLVYAETSPKIRSRAASVDAAELYKTAVLFRDFGENYHERLLEEKHIFPVVVKGSGEAAKYVPILMAQHERGREITDYIMELTKGGKIGKANAEPMAHVIDTFVLMYQNHAAREDTIVFPAWKTHFSEKQLDELSDQFEDIEHKMFGKDGFDDAVAKIAAIEGALGYADLSQFTPPPPPKVLP